MHSRKEAASSLVLKQKTVAAKEINLIRRALFIPCELSRKRRLLKDLTIQEFLWGTQDKIFEKTAVVKNLVCVCVCVCVHSVMLNSLRPHGL